MRIRDLFVTELFWFRPGRKSKILKPVDDNGQKHLPTGMRIPRESIVSVERSVRSPWHTRDHESRGQLCKPWVEYSDLSDVLDPLVFEGEADVDRRVFALRKDPVTVLAIHY